MFSGRITEMGTVVSGNGRLVIEAPKTAGGLEAGGSVCVSGACLSAVEVGDTWFRADLSAETAQRTTLAGLAPGSRVNLELPLKVGDRLDGHLVQGHADAVGKVTVAGEPDGCGRRVWIRPPRRFLDDVVAKASVCVDGVSLTVAEVVRDRFSVALIPLTLRETTLGALGPGDRVNLEADMAATVRRLAHPGARPADFLRPGHVFPLAGRPGGLAERRGHTEASLALCEAAGLPGVAAICEVMDPDGHMLTGPAVERFALRWGIPMIAVSELAAPL